MSLYQLATNSDNQTAMKAVDRLSSQKLPNGDDLLTSYGMEQIDSTIILSVSPSEFINQA
jgi:hypothetical protein